MASLTNALRPLQSFGPKTFTRGTASSRRTAKALKMHPHPSMQPDATATSSHIIYNPPSAAPTPLITPRLFLPRGDPRLETTSAAVLPENYRLPPPVNKPYEKSYHLTPEDFKEIRRLRNSDPRKWNRNALAKKFNTSTLFIGMVAQASEARLSAMKKMTERVKENWGMKRTIAREERAKRRAGWGGADGL